MARTVNHYFNTLGGRGEQRLVEDLIVENIRINGMQVTYLPRIFRKKDPIFGEDPLNSFSRNFQIEMYFDNPGGGGLGGDRYLISKFGLEMRETANFIVSRRRFNQTVQYDGYSNLPQTSYTLGEMRPMEGDLIYVPLTNDLFQINFSEHESVFYQIGYRYIWRLDAHKFDYSSEKFNTGIENIDAVQELFENLDSVDKDPLADNTTLLNRAETNLDVREKNIFGDVI